jgi:TrmH family RNA methyltransferase
MAVDVQDPGNVGALLRAAEAGGATGAFVSGTSANPFSWKALRGSMGSGLRLPVVGGITVETAIACMSTSGLRMIATVPRGGDTPENLDWRGRVGLLLGGEGPGLSDAVIARCSARVTIPMAPTVESLNVAVAGGILIYAARRQRTMP